MQQSYSVNVIKAFISLLRAGLWEQDAQLSAFNDINYQEIYRLAEEQSLIGIITAGLEHVKDVRIPQEDILTFVGTALQLESRNKAMNEFIAELMMKLRQQEIPCVLVKGQGIAQCYERPLWRASGDIDLLVCKQDYIMATQYFERISEEIVIESEPSKERLHQGFCVRGWLVELHGTLHSHISKRIDAIIDKLQHDSLTNGSVRIWNNNGIDVLLPSVNNDVILVFSHILQHLYREGIGLRQICDWCRLLWKYREEIDVNRLKHCLKEMSIVSEWKAFASLAVVYLGMPEKTMPLYDHTYDKKAHRILSIVFENGNFGQNKNRDYTKNTSASVRRLITLWLQTKASLKLAIIFPRNSVLSWFNYCKDGAKSIIAKNKKY